MDFAKLNAEALALQTPEYLAVISDWKEGRTAGLDGAPDDESKSGNWRQAWASGNVKRRVLNGEVIAVLTAGTRCKGCGSVSYGYRMGCRCKGRIEWGALVLSAKDEVCAPFHLWDELRAYKAAGTPVVDCDTGADFPLEEKGGA